MSGQLGLRKTGLRSHNVDSDGQKFVNGSVYLLMLERSVPGADPDLWKGGVKNEVR